LRTVPRISDIAQRASRHISSACEASATARFPRVAGGVHVPVSAEDVRAGDAEYRAAEAMHLHAFAVNLDRRNVSQRV
jgi:hypothetical protein